MTLRNFHPLVSSVLTLRDAEAIFDKLVQSGSRDFAKHRIPFQHDSVSIYPAGHVPSAISTSSTGPFGPSETSPLLHSF